MGLGVNYYYSVRLWIHFHPVIELQSCMFVSYMPCVFIPFVATVSFWCCHSSASFVNEQQQQQQLGASSHMMCEASAFLRVTDEVG